MWILMKPTLNIREAAAYLGVCLTTARRLAKNGIIPGRKVGRAWRFDPEALQGYMYGDPTERAEEWHLEKETVSISEIGTSVAKEYDDLLARRA